MDYTMATFLSCWLMSFLGNVAFMRLWGGDWDDCSVGAACGMFLSPLFLAIAFGGIAIAPGYDAEIWAAVLFCSAMADSMLIALACEARLPFLLGPLMTGFCAVCGYLVADSWSMGFSWIAMSLVLMAMCCDHLFLSLPCAIPYAVSVADAAWIFLEGDGFLSYCAVGLAILGIFAIPILFSRTLWAEGRRRKAAASGDGRA